MEPIQRNSVYWDLMCILENRRFINDGNLKLFYLFLMFVRKHKVSEDPTHLKKVLVSC